ncbi:MAG: hypothetical protein J6S67_10345 [Methanobrevibacter sp.]|nr:hypothetical protein [Methanobrevibacter sp.]
MSKDIMIYFDDDGLAKEYDDTYDVTIHCENQEDHDKLMNKLINEYTRSDESIICQAMFDKMRDEILHLHDWAFSREAILKIIDKYKAGSEV